MKPTSTRRRLVAIRRRTRELLMIARGLASTDHPVLAHIVSTRRCNLACAYCNEYDRNSAPVPLADMRERIDHLARLGTSIVTVSGGEPLLHPELDDIVAHIRKRGIIAGMITNGYLLTAERIERLNRAGLDHLQISIDNIEPDDISKKSLKVLDKKLDLLRDHAEFHVNINSVLGSGVSEPEDALAIARRALALGFTSTVGIIHDSSGQLQPLNAADRKVYEAMKAFRKRSYAKWNSLFQDNIAAGHANNWRCRAGSRYLYVCEDGLVHYCSQQRGYPGIPLAEYTTEHVRREFVTQKGCAPNCTITCVHQVARIDGWRAPQELRPERRDYAPGEIHIPGVQAPPPLPAPPPFPSTGLVNIGIGTEGD